MYRPGPRCDGPGMPDPNRPLIALAAAMDLPEGQDVPDWVHLLPAVGADIHTFDGRGPYRVEDAAAVIAASFAADPRDATGLILDENHAQDRAAPLGLSSPARGKITEMEARADGIWGRVAWNRAGRELVADRAYRGISPTFVHDAAGRVIRVLRASLVNNPNLRGLTALNMETGMSFTARLAEALGKPATATEDELLAAARAAAATTALQSSLAEIGTALGVEGGNAGSILAAARILKASAADLTALQAENAAFKAAAKRSKAEAFIDQAIREKRSGVSAANREEMISSHMENPAFVEKMISAQPQLGEIAHLGGTPPGAGALAVALSADQEAAAKALGISKADYLKTLNAEKEAS